MKKTKVIQTYDIARAIKELIDLLEEVAGSNGDEVVVTMETQK